MTEATVASANGNMAMREWSERTRIVLTPVAAPAIVGWFAFAVSAGLVGTIYAQWWGDETSLVYIAPMLVAFGGIAQLISAVHAYRARDAIGAHVHSFWGAFWLAFGLAYLAVGAGIADPALLRVPLGVTFLAAALLTAPALMVGALENVLHATTMAVVTAGSAIAGIGLIRDSEGVLQTSGWFLAAAALLSWYYASALMMAETTGRELLPIGEFDKASNIPEEDLPPAAALSSGLPRIVGRVASSR